MPCRHQRVKPGPSLEPPHSGGAWERDAALRVQAGGPSDPSDHRGPGSAGRRGCLGAPVSVLSLLLGTAAPRAADSCSHGDHGVAGTWHQQWGRLAWVACRSPPPCPAPPQLTSAPGVGPPPGWPPGLTHPVCPAPSSSLCLRLGRGVPAPKASPAPRSQPSARPAGQ